jgi:hypothetical protein
MGCLLNETYPRRVKVTVQVFLYKRRDKRVKKLDVV